MRAFLALEVPEPLISALMDGLRRAKRELSGIPLRWVPAENIHLTLQFFADLSEENIGLVKALLESELNDFAPIPISLSQVGVFPNMKRPRVLWVGVDDAGVISGLHSRLNSQLQHLGFAQGNQPFSAHITLARLKRGAKAEHFDRLSTFLQGQEKMDAEPTLLSEAALFRSELRPSGARYTKLFSVQFGKLKEES